MGVVFLYAVVGASISLKPTALCRQKNSVYSDMKQGGSDPQARLGDRATLRGIHSHVLSNSWTGFSNIIQWKRWVKNSTGGLSSLFESSADLEFHVSEPSYQEGSKALAYAGSRGVEPI